MNPHGVTATPGTDERPGDRFGTVERSRDYVAELLQVIEATASDVREELRQASGGEARWREAFQVVAYKLEKLDSHIRASQRLLNDLVALRHLVDGEPLAVAA